MSAKYPRIPHLPSSPGGTSDDRRLGSVDHLLGIPLVVTEKMDGANLCLTRAGLYARTHTRAPRHRFFDLAKAAWSALASRIPATLSVFGEWMYARHSIGYDRLPGYFLVFGVREDGSGTWWSWPETGRLAGELGLPAVPELWSGTFERAEDLERRCADLAREPSVCGAPQREGVVVRPADAFTEFGKAVAKWVRAGHVQTGDRWTRQPLARNGLLPHPDRAR